MSSIGIYFGTDTGTTRLIAKKIARKLGKRASKPVNVNRTSVEQFLSHRQLILGTPTYGLKQLPGRDTNISDGSWQEFLPQLEKESFNGISVALFGLGDQQKYPDRFVDSMIHLQLFFSARGARMVGQWSTEGYQFDASAAVIDDQFVGLALDQRNQPLLSEARMDAWLAQLEKAW